MHKKKIIILVLLLLLVLSFTVMSIFRIYIKEKRQILDCGGDINECMDSSSDALVENFPSWLSNKLNLRYVWFYFSDFQRSKVEQRRVEKEREARAEVNSIFRQSDRQKIGGNYYTNGDTIGLCRFYNELTCSVIDSADPDTFEYLGNNSRFEYARDKNYVYKNYSIIEGVTPDDFIVPQL